MNASLHKLSAPAESAAAVTHILIIHGKICLFQQFSVGWRRHRQTSDAAQQHPVSGEEYSWGPETDFTELWPSCCLSLDKWNFSRQLYFEWSPKLNVWGPQKSLNIALALVFTHKLHEGWFTLDVRRNIFTERVVEHWNVLPKEVVFKRRLNVALSGQVNKVVLVHRLDLISQNIFPT